MAFKKTELYTQPLLILSQLLTLHQEINCGQKNLKNTFIDKWLILLILHNFGTDSRLKVVKQGCIFDPTLFNFYINWIVKSPESDIYHPPKLALCLPTTLLYADDVVLLTSIDLKRLLRVHALQALQQIAYIF